MSKINECYESMQNYEFIVLGRKKILGRAVLTSEFLDIHESTDG
jgi:hypothetical protein